MIFKLYVCFASKAQAFLQQSSAVTNQLLGNKRVREIQLALSIKRDYLMRQSAGLNLSTLSLRELFSYHHPRLINWELTRPAQIYTCACCTWSPRSPTSSYQGTLCTINTRAAVPLLLTCHFHVVVFLFITISFLCVFYNIKQQVCRLIPLNHLFELFWPVVFFQ